MRGVTACVILALITLASGRDCGQIVVSGGGGKTDNFTDCTTASYLAVTGTMLTTISFPSLQEMTGLILILSNKKTTVVSFPQLTLSTNAVSIQNNPLLETASFPLLTQARNFAFSGNPVLASVDLSELAMATASFAVSGTVLPALSLPKMVFTTTFTVKDAGLGSISAPMLTRISTLTIQNNAALTAISMDAVTTLENSLTISNNAALKTISMHTLPRVVVSLTIEKNYALDTIDFLGMTSVPANPILTDYKTLYSCEKTLMADFNAQCPSQTQPSALRTRHDPLARMLARGRSPFARVH